MDDISNGSDDGYGFEAHEHGGQSREYQYYTLEADREKKRRKRKSGFAKTMATLGFAVLFGVVSSTVFLISTFYGADLLGMNFSPKKEIKNAAPLNSSDAGLSTSKGHSTSDIPLIVENVMPSIVSITNLSVEQVRDIFWGNVFEKKSESSGTGIIISQTDNELLIVTNNHVIVNSETLTVTFIDNENISANIKGTDPVNDVAVIAVSLKSIPDATMSKIAVAALGNSDEVKVGEPVIAIGNALGFGQTVTNGIISAKDREIKIIEGGSTGVKLLQTNAAINHGNSGGALVNAEGEVIGINCAKVEGNSVEGMGYAIPISDVTDIINNLMSQKTKVEVPEAKRGYLGIGGIDVTPEYAEAFDMPIGVYVKEVMDNGAASAAGIKPGDIITKFNGTTINGMNTLKAQLKYYAIGDTVTLSVQIPQSGGKYQEGEYTLTLSAMPK